MSFQLKGVIPPVPTIFNAQAQFDAETARYRALKAKLAEQQPAQ